MRIKVGFFCFLLLLSLMACLPFGLAVEPSWYQLTREPALISALEALSQTSAKPCIADMQARQVKLLFKNMRELGKTYQNHDAVSLISASGMQVLVMNEKHQTAPPEALAAMISHEVMHSDNANSIAEEQAAWRREAQTWIELTTMHPELLTFPVSRVPLVDRENAILVLLKQNKLDAEIEHNEAYQSLPKHSPGF